jgi:Tol biopolymer transport system component
MAALAKLSQTEVARRFMTIAWEEGAAGVSMECVDYNNYQAPTREIIAHLGQTTCRTVRPWDDVKTGSGILIPEHRAPRERPALAKPLMVEEVHADGLTWLPVGPGNNTEPAYSPDGTRIAFQSDRDGNAQLFLYDLAAGTVQRLDTGPGFSMFPAWSADGAHVLYSHGYFPKTAFQTVADAMPGWHGGHLNEIKASLRESLNGVNVWQVECAENATPEQLTSGLVCDMLPAGRPNGQAVWFSSTRGVQGRLPDSANTMTIQRREPDGSVRTVYRQDGAYAMQPTVSPDGNYVAFARITSYAGMWHIMIARTANETGASVRLTPSGLAAYAPRWSPDGRFIAFTGYRDGDPGWGIFVMRADGRGDAVRVSTGLAQTRSAAWAPDGKTLVFEARKDSRYTLSTLPVSPWIGTVAAAAEPVSVDRLFARRPFFATDAPDENGIAHVFDGDTVSFWRVSGTPRWVEARFPEPVTIAGIDLVHGMPDYAKYPSGASSARGYRLQAYVDETWKDLVPPVNDVPRYLVGQSLEVLCRRHRFAPVTTQRFRLVLTATNDTGCRVSSPDTPSVPPDKRVVYLREIELLDADGQPVIR